MLQSRRFVVTMHTLFPLLLYSVLLIHHLSTAHLFPLEWNLFQRAHKKIYTTSIESSLRRQIFTDHLLYITAHNLANDLSLNTFRLGVNHLSDRLTSEVIAERNGALSQRTMANATVRAAPRLGATLASASATASIAAAQLPASWNWTDAGAVTHVRDQGACGSCWSIAAAGALEGAHFRKTGQLVALSQQHLLDCARSESSFGCGGGRMEDAFEYVRRNGIATESSYPYDERDGSCRAAGGQVGASAVGYAYLPQNDEHSLMVALVNNGPICVSIDASHRSFQLYSSGVYFELMCTNHEVNHGVLLVGYGTDAHTGSDYWLIKNSWGPGWGENGYIRMARKWNNCGVACDPMYPIV